MQAEEELKHNAFLNDSAFAPAGAKGTIARNVDEATQGVVIMNAHCIIQSVNKV